MPLANQATLFLRKYASNSGTAFGLTEHEALLHSLLEVLERHCTSLLYLGILGQQDLTLKFIPDAHDALTALGLSEELSSLPGFHLYGGQVLGDTWFFTAFETNPRGRMAEFGAGCSRDPLHALGRAVTEYAQCLGLVTAAVGEKEDHKAMQLFDELPGLKPLAHLLPPPSTTKHLLSDVVPGLANHSIPTSSPEDLLYQTTAALKKTGWGVFADVIEVAQRGYVSQVYVPRLERFHLIRVGSQVAPNSALL